MKKRLLKKAFLFFLTVAAAALLLRLIVFIYDKMEVINKVPPDLVAGVWLANAVLFLILALVIYSCIKELLSKEEGE